MKLTVSQEWVEAEKKIDANSSNQLFLDVTKTAGLINKVYGVQTRHNEQASVDKTQNPNVWTSCRYLHCEEQCGRMTSEVAVNAYSQLGLQNHSFMLNIMCLFVISSVCLQVYVSLCQVRIWTGILVDGCFHNWHFSASLQKLLFDYTGGDGKIKKWDLFLILERTKNEKSLFQLVAYCRLKFLQEATYPFVGNMFAFWGTPAAFITVLI